MTQTAPTDVLSRYPAPRHRLTREDYHRLGEAGVLREDHRVELLEGQLVDMSPIAPRHALAVDALNKLLVIGVGDRAVVRPQNPIGLDPYSEPQPDLVLARQPWRGFPDTHPGAEDILLLVEVADTSINIDRGAKMELYARAGIQEFWIVDLTTNSVHVHRSPTGDEYQSINTIAATDVLTVEALPGLYIPATPLFH